MRARFFTWRSRNLRIEIDTTRTPRGVSGAAWVTCENPTENREAEPLAMKWVWRIARSRRRSKERATIL